jgi:transcriptional regulator with XRE-family HTH domain
MCHDGCMTQTGDQQRAIVDWTRGNFGRRMRAIREERGLTQLHVVDLLNSRFDLHWHQTTCGKVESGERPARVAEAIAIAFVLGVQLEELLYESPEKVVNLTAEGLARDRLTRVSRFVDEQLRHLELSDTATATDNLTVFRYGGE